MRRVHLTITGRVQGVAYRASAAHAARAAGLTGWVRNRRDGSVEAEVEGAPDAVDRFIAWCRRGPALARVGAVTVRDTDPCGASAFEVLPTA